MSNLKLKSSELPEEWKGYTINELKYRRAYVATCSELAKERLTRRVRDMRSNTLHSATSMAKGLTQSIPYVGTAFAAAKWGGKAFKFIKHLRDRRKTKRYRLRD